MLDQSIQENLDKIHNNIRIIWIAIMASLGVMLIVAHAAGDQVGQNPEAMTMLRYPLMLAAVLILLAVPMIRRFLLKAGAQAAKATDNPSEKFSILAARYSSAVIATPGPVRIRNHIRFGFCIFWAATCPPFTSSLPPQSWACTRIARAGRRSKTW
jgi:hypothetical protein